MDRWMVEKMNGQMDVCSIHMDIQLKHTRKFTFE